MEAAESPNSVPKVDRRAVRRDDPASLRDRSLTRRGFLRVGGGAAAVGALDQLRPSITPARAQESGDAENLRAVAKSYGVTIGTLAVRTIPGTISPLVSEHYNGVLISAGPLEWKRIYLSRDYYSFNDLDMSLGLATKNDLSADLQHLVYGSDGEGGFNRIPKWVYNEVERVRQQLGDEAAEEEALRIIDEFITAVMTHVIDNYPDVVHVVSVVNEALNLAGGFDIVWAPNGTPVESNFFSNNTGRDELGLPIYLARAFQTFRDAAQPRDEQTQPIIPMLNEHAVEIPGTPKAEANLYVVSELFKQFPEMAAGFQMHTDLGPAPPYNPNFPSLTSESEILTYAENFGVTLSRYPSEMPKFITEMDVMGDRLVTDLGYGPGYAAYLQEFAWYHLTRTYFESGGKRIMTFGPSNSSSWTNLLDRPDANPHLLDDNDQPNGAYASVIQAMHDVFS